MGKRRAFVLKSTIIFITLIEASNCNNKVRAGDLWRRWRGLSVCPPVEQRWWLVAFSLVIILIGPKGGGKIKVFPWDPPVSRVGGVVSGN